MKSRHWLTTLGLLLAHFMTGSPLEARSSHLPPTGKEVVLEVEAAYNRGEYDSFLNALHHEYERAGKAGAIRGVFEVARIVMQEKPKSEKTRVAPNETRSGVEQKRNRRLLEVIDASSNEEIAKIIDAVVFYSISSDALAILDQLSALKYVLPENAKGTVANKISALETEYTIKSHLLDIANIRSGSSPDELSKKKIALTLEKFARMKEAALHKKDLEWVAKIEKAQYAYQSQRKFSWNFKILQDIGRGKIFTENSVEEKVKQIMMEYAESN